MTEDANDRADPILSAAFGAAPQHESSAGFSTSREEYVFGEDDGDDDQDNFGPSLNQLNGYRDDVDYYAVLGLPRNPPPSDAQIRSAFHLLSPSFHPDKHPGAEQQARVSFEKLEDAYEVLIDPQKRAVYDLLGEQGVRREWDVYGAMGMHGPNRDLMVGIRAMDAEEFKTWFLETMRKQERQILESMVENRTNLTLGLNAMTVVPPKADGFFSYFVTLPRVEVSNYNVRTSFKLPLPQRTNAELKINAGIGGPLTQLTREIEYEMETGEKETRSYKTPVSIFTRSITLGANGSLTVPSSDFPSILYLFRGCEIEAGAALFPAPVLRTSASWSLTPLKGARPFRLDLQTTYGESIMRMPPVVAISVSRRLGPRHFADIGWSSGMWFWPSLLEATLAPFLQLGIRGDDIISMTSYSNCRIGFTSYPITARPADQTSKDSETVSDSNAHDVAGKLSPLSEAWGFELTSSPFGGSMSVSYGRNLFRGHVQTPLRSRWSHVGYHKNRDLSLSRPQAVRLDLQGSLSLDGTIGWMVQGSRGIGEFSRVGLGVGVQGPRGLVVSVTYNRLGQSINVPILICPLDLVNIDVIAVSIAIPWTLCAVFHYGLILPRARRRHSEALKKRRRELEAVVQARRTESRRHVELMAGRVMRRQAVEMESHGLVVVEARYGTTGRSRSNANTAASNHGTGTMIDVTIPVAGLVHRSQLIIARGVNKSQIIGFHDPAPLKSKVLQVHYLFGDREHFVEVRDDEALSCPRDSHKV